jgi:hypothetical protein
MLFINGWSSVVNQWVINNWLIISETIGPVNKPAGARLRAQGKAQSFDIEFTKGSFAQFEFILAFC